MPPFESSPERIAADQEHCLATGDLDALVPLLLEGMLADLRAERIDDRIDTDTYRDQLTDLVAVADAAGLPVLDL